MYTQPYLFSTRQNLLLTPFGSYMYSPEDFFTTLNNPETQNSALNFLGQVVVKQHKSIVASFLEIIKAPDNIEDTNTFASLLVDLKSDQFLPALIDEIAKATPGKETWLADYMYALEALLDKTDMYYPGPESFVSLLGDWMFSTGGGEIAWKSSGILANLDNESCLPYLKRGVKDTSFFHLVRSNCLQGLVNKYGAEHIELIQSLQNDKDEDFREAVLDCLDYLEQRS
ncbi:MAG: hypothetical protein AAF518_21935 [Spirochaetota bacterium]